MLMVLCSWCIEPACVCALFICMQGGDLFDTILHCQHFSEPDAMEAIQQLGLALVYLHAHRIVHRDINQRIYL